MGVTSGLLLGAKEVIIPYDRTLVWHYYVETTCRETRACQNVWESLEKWSCTWLRRGSRAECYRNLTKTIFDEGHLWDSVLSMNRTTKKSIFITTAQRYGRTSGEVDIFMVQNVRRFWHSLHHKPSRGSARVLIPPRHSSPQHRIASSNVEST